MEEHPQVDQQQQFLQECAHRACITNSRINNKTSKLQWVFGFKPSFGIVPRTGILKTADTLDTISLMTSNFSDIRHFFNDIRVKGHNYPFANLVDKHSSIIQKNKKFRLLAVKCENIENNINQEIRLNFERLILKLKKLAILLSKKFLQHQVF